MTQPQAAGLVTPEAVPLEFETAGLGSRFLAASIDAVVQGVLLVAVLLVLAAASGDGGDVATATAVAVILVVLFGVFWGYPVLFETFRRGRTPGKSALGLRVVTVEGAPIGFRHAAIRATLGMVDFYLTSGAAAVLSVLFTRDNRRLGDLAAGTIVLRERRSRTAPESVSFPVPSGHAGYVAVLDVTGLSAADYGAVRSYLTRAPSLAAEVRADLAARFAGPLAARLHPPPPAGMSHETYLRCVAAAYQRRGSGGGGAPVP